ncbi:MAG: hypothetical protein RL227_806 [Pseudomonadota bacterium]
MKALLVDCLLEPRRTMNLDERQWHVLLLQCRQQGLLARLAEDLQAQGLFDGAPAKARSHMHAAKIAALSTQTAVRFEINRVMRALQDIAAPVVLMKGVAYVLAGLPPARGRFVGDVDVMVPRAQIEMVEQRLLAAGWACADLDAYDQRYYREWTHEIPPMQHPERDTPVDIHHTIAALTSRVHPDAQAILAACVPVPGTGLHVMAPADMVLHSAVHLFNDEVSMPLRDLFDLHDLLVHFASRPGFWDELLARAQLHGLQRVLYHLLRQTRLNVATPVPPEVMAASERAAPAAPIRWLMDRLFRLHFAADPLSGRSWLRQGGHFLLYLRAHWLRMPFPMLARHLAVKSWKRLRARSDPSEPALG